MNDFKKDNEKFLKKTIYDNINISIKKLETIILFFVVLLLVALFII